MALFTLAQFQQNCKFLINYVMNEFLNRFFQYQFFVVRCSRGYVYGAIFMAQGFQRIEHQQIFVFSAGNIIFANEHKNWRQIGFQVIQRSVFIHYRDRVVSRVVQQLFDIKVRGQLTAYQQKTHKIFIT